MEMLSQKHKNLEKSLKRAQRLHETGDLSGALKAYRLALPYARDDKTQQEIRSQIDELHDMLTFVQSVDTENQRSQIQVIDWLKDNTQTILTGLILLASILVLVLIVPGLIAQFGAADSPQTLLIDELEDKYERGDSSATITELKGHRDSAGLYIKESDSRVTLSIPAEILEPYPSKYVIQAQVPVFAVAEPGSDLSPIATLALNSQVLLTGKNPANTWLRVRLSDLSSGWVRAAALGDSPYRTPAQIDAEIKASMGGRYWQILVQGSEAPFRYFLRINAPNAEEAYAAVLAGYQDYASRQLLKLINTHTHQKVAAMEVEAAPLKPELAPNPLHVELTLYSLKNNQSRQLAGHKQISVVRGPNTGRYLLQTPLEGL